MSRLPPVYLPSLRDGFLTHTILPALKSGVIVRRPPDLFVPVLAEFVFL